MAFSSSIRFFLGLYALTLLVLGELKWEDLRLLGWPVEEKKKAEFSARINLHGETPQSW